MIKGAKEKGGGQQGICTVMSELEPGECIFMVQLFFVTQEINSCKTGNVLYV
jgi:hypothetical protein